ncbi:MAG: bifunctional phosphopantothenoylcysteine decarboxylase/phosphopantothenate--cysteine ligase CoaBC [Bacilli bacterium]|nr:bifunctional phosphopantothenoylcysteine decarboxylase/phosphopantothenate--cysteine ligase CoaBC [Bacilli bacterium]
MKKKIVIGITGSIAAFKAIQLISDLNKMNYDLEVIMSEAATRFVTPLSIQSLTKKKVYVDIFDDDPEVITHIDIVKNADLFIIVPASANTIAKVAHGIADSMLTAAFLAATCPKLIAPAMNVHMYENPITTENINKCKDLGMIFIEPDNGLLACGDVGKGKLPSQDIIIDMIEYALSPKPLKGKKVLVTAGPTIESIDPVRYITNHSSGKMGYAIAKAAFHLGADVTLISGPTALKKPMGVNTIDILSADDMFNQCQQLFDEQDYVIKAAAVGDYSPIHYEQEKIKKHDSTMTLELKKNNDILAYLGKHKTHQKICGFAMETQDLIENATKKLMNKNCDMLVANHLKTEGAGFQGDTNVVTLLFKDHQKQLELMKKSDLAYIILNELMECED